MVHSAILSTNNNTDYLFALPLVIQSWNLQNWQTHTIMVEVPSKVYDLIQYYTNADLNFFYAANDIKVSETNPALFTQCVRMYWTQQLPQDGYYILSDADMLIGSSFLNRDFDKVNSFGHDLTGYGQVPMCYVGALGKYWNEIIGPYGFRKDVISYANPASNDFYKAWGADQDILTAKLFNYTQGGVNGKVIFHDRGTDPDNSGLPMGRLDRYNWVYPKGEIHDCHLMRRPYTENNFNLLSELVHKLYPQADWGWLQAYRREFLKLV